MKILKNINYIILVFVLFNGLVFSNIASENDLFYENSYSDKFYKDFYGKYSDEELKEVIQDYKIVFVAGFLSSLAKPTKVKNWNSQYYWLINDLKLNRNDVEIADINSSETCDFNSKILLNIVIKSDKKVLFVGHSKGGLDILDFLIKHPNLHSKVGGVISFQTPYQGSPVADVFHNNSFFRPLISSILKLSGGRTDSLVDLRTDIRQNYLEEKKEQIEKILETIPLLSIAGYKCTKNKCEHLVPYNIQEKRKSSFFEPLMRPFAMFFKSISSERDYFVSRDSQILPFSNFIEVQGVNHLSFVVDQEKQVDKIEITKAAIILLLNK